MKFLVVVALLACGAFAEEGPKCQAPNGGGLTPVLEEFIGMVPLDQVLELALTAMTSDPETQLVMEYLSGLEFQYIVSLVQSQPSFNSLLQFACNDLYVDAAYYFNKAAGIFGFPEVYRANSRFAVRTPGFNGLIQDILAMLPVDKMQALFESKVQSDYYVQLAMQKINSDEFGAIIETLQGNAAYGDLKNRLAALGVDVESLVETIGKLFRP